MQLVDIQVTLLFRRLDIVIKKTIMNVLNINPQIQNLISALDQAVETHAAQPKCQRIRQVLMDSIAQKLKFLNDNYTETHPEGYARRLLHHDPKNRYSVVVMVWDAGQGTVLHDHGGNWCVEVVYSGQIRTKTYNLQAESPENVYQFKLKSEQVAKTGEADILIPPFEYHILDNPYDTKAVTIHVYHGELLNCNIFLPIKDEKYRKESRRLCYTP